MATYKEAGVDIAAGEEAVARIKGLAAGTYSRAVLKGVGLFGSVFALKKFRKFSDPLLVSTIDGVGTKLMVAALMNKWDSVGKDLVNHSSNDVLCQGAEPMYFLDYVATSHLRPEIVAEIVRGMSEACIDIGCALVGGETAEMPGVYEEGQHDVAGCMVGIVERKELIDGSKIKAGDELIALQSNGLHTNGYSLARKVLLKDAGFGINDFVQELGCGMGEELLKVHRSYSRAVLSLKKKFDIRGIAHITGGGLPGNIPRILPNGLGAEIKEAALRPQQIFKLIQEKGDISNDEMYRTFNMGAGLVLVVPRTQSKKIVAAFERLGEQAYFIGRTVRGRGVIFR